MMQSITYTLFKNARLLTPGGIKSGSLLSGGGKILATGEDLAPPPLAPCVVVDVKQRLLAPGLIDQHVHLIGGGGEDGYHTRTPEVMLGQLLKAGITSVMGLLGTDGATRHVTSLFAKVQGLRQEGISAWMLTGSYEVPTVTLTGSVRDDIAFLEPVLGAKTAISDHRSSFPSCQELIRLASQVRAAALMARKPGLVVMHLGNASCALEPLEEVLDNCDVPVRHFLPTHVNRQRHLWDHAMQLAITRKANLDITSGINPLLGARGAVKPSLAVQEARDRGISLTQLTLSSDGNGSIPVFDNEGNLNGLTVAGFGSLMDEIRDLQAILPLEEAWSLVSSNVARRLKLPMKGELSAGCDADILLLDDRLEIRSLWTKGQLMLHEGEVLVKGTFE
ncbi:beta-aspartyl-peptidase [Aeromonas jandaei]